MINSINRYLFLCSYLLYPLTIEVYYNLVTGRGSRGRSLKLNKFLNRRVGKAFFVRPSVHHAACLSVHMKESLDLRARTTMHDSIGDSLLILL